MNLICRISIALLFCIASTVTISAQSGPAIFIENIRCPYPQTVTSLQEVDFRNMTLRPDCADLSGEDALKLQDGKFERKDQPYGGRQVELGEALIPKLEGYAPRAVIGFNVLSCGGSCSEMGYVQLLELIDGHPTIFQQLRFDMQAEGTGNWFDTKTNTLHITARSNDNTPHCCPEHVDEAEYALKGGKFVLKSWEQLSLK